MDVKNLSLQSPYQPAGHQEPAISGLVQGLQDKVDKQILLGVTGSGKTFVMANIIHRTQRPAIIIAHNKTLAAQLYAEMKQFFPDNAVEYFVSYYDYYQPEAYVPASNLFIEKEASINEQVEQMRLSATKSILQRQDTIIVATVSAIYGLGDPEMYLKMVMHLRVNEKMAKRTFIDHLVAMQYERNDIELTRACYRVRGDTVDIIMPENEQEAVRVSWFDDEIESIHTFDPLTGRLKKKLPRVTFFPKSHYVTPAERIRGMITPIKEELQQRLEALRADNRLVEVQRLDERVRYDLEMMKELGYCSGIENYSRYLSGREPGMPPPTLLDYLPDNTILFIDESHVTVPQIGAMYAGDRSRKNNLVDFGFRLPSARDNRPLTFEEFEDYGIQTIYTSATPGDYELEEAKQCVELVVRPTGLVDPEVIIRPASGQVDDLLAEIHATIAKKERVLVTTLTKRMAENLSEYYQEMQLKVKYMHSDIDTVERIELIHGLRTGEFDVLIGINLLREGLDIPEVSLVAILDADKEGFLRSHRSLIQTIGRASRHVHGRAILYADKLTRSMQQAIDETERRRQIQQDFNTEHGITPRSVRKSADLMLEIEKAVESPTENSLDVDELKQYEAMSAKQLAKALDAMVKQMHQHAEKLEFEEASAVRDRWQMVKKIFNL